MGWAIADNFLDIAALGYVLLNSASLPAASPTAAHALERQLAKQKACKARRGQSVSLCNLVPAVRCANLNHLAIGMIAMVPNLDRRADVSS
jgi:hypothetical protein